MNLTTEVISAIDRLCDLAEHGGHPLDKEAAELVRRELKIRKRSDSFQGMPADLRTQMGYPEKLSSMLDSVASRLEKKGFVKEAHEIDKIADYLDEKADLITEIPNTLLVVANELSALAIDFSNAMDKMNSIPLIVDKYELIENTAEEFKSKLGHLMEQLEEAGNNDLNALVAQLNRKLKSMDSMKEGTPPQKGPVF